MSSSNEWQWNSSKQMIWLQDAPIGLCPDVTLTLTLICICILQNYKNAEILNILAKNITNTAHT